MRGEFLQHHPAPPNPNNRDKFAGVPQVGPEASIETGTVKDTERYFADILSGAGNHEIRALMGILMEPGRRYTSYGMYQRIKASHAEFPGYVSANHSEPGQYAEFAMAPRGLVIHERDEETGRSFFSKTAKGQLADSLSGHLLAFSERRERTLPDYLGTTTAPNAGVHSVQTPSGETIEHRREAPFNRYRILKTILELGAREGHTVQIKEIAEALDGESPSLITSTLIALKNNGIVHYTSPDSDKAYATYEVVPGRTRDDLPSFTDYPTLREYVFDAAIAMTESGDTELNSKTLYDEIVRDNPEMAEKDGRYLRGNISWALSKLTEAGHMRRTDEWQQARTKIWLDPEQREDVGELVKIIDTFRAGDEEFLDEGRQLGAEIANDPERVSYLINKSLRTSPFKDRTAMEDHRAAIVQVIERSDAAVTFTAREINQILREEFGIKTVWPATNMVLRDMRRSGEIVERRRGQSFHYGRVLEPGQEAGLYEQYLTKKYGEAIPPNVLPPEESAEQAPEQQEAIPVTLADFRTRLQDSLREYRLHEPDSEAAKNVMESIRAIRSDATYQRLLAEQDAEDERSPSVSELRSVPEAPTVHASVEKPRGGVIFAQQDREDSGAFTIESEGADGSNVQDDDRGSTSITLVQSDGQKDIFRRQDPIDDREDDRER
jgi:hypothetical protein